MHLLTNNLVKEFKYYYNDILSQVYLKSYVKLLNKFSPCRENTAKYTLCVSVAARGVVSSLSAGHPTLFQPVASFWGQRHRQGVWWDTFTFLHIYLDKHPDALGNLIIYR